eukprot:Opistho-2@71550
MQQCSRVHLQGEGAVLRNPINVAFCDQAVHELFGSRQVGGLFRAYVDDEEYVCPHVVLAPARDVWSETVGFPIKGRPVDATHKALIPEHAVQLGSLRAQIGKSVDDDARQNVHHNHNHHKEEGHVVEQPPMKDGVRYRRRAEHIANASAAAKPLVDGGDGAHEQRPAPLLPVDDKIPGKKDLPNNRKRVQHNQREERCQRKRAPVVRHASNDVLQNVRSRNNVKEQHAVKVWAECKARDGTQKVASVVQRPPSRELGKALAGFLRVALGDVVLRKPYADFVRLLQCAGHVHVLAENDNRRNHLEVSQQLQ